MPRFTTAVSATLAALLALVSLSPALAVDLTNGGPDTVTTGDAIDETAAGDLPRTVTVAEPDYQGSGLELTVTAFKGLGGAGDSDDINATSHSLGINSGRLADGSNDDDSAEFDAGESLTFTFNKDVAVRQFLFNAIMQDDGDAGTLTVGDKAYPLTPETTDGGSDLAFPDGLAIPAGTPITVACTGGNFGMQGLEMDVK